MSIANLKRPLPSLIAVVCLTATLAPVSSLAADAAEIEALRKEIAELRARVEKLEGDVSSGVAVNPAKVVQPVAGGWQAAHNWDLISKGMEQYRVEQILGEADDTRRIHKFEIWQYGKGEVKFYQGRVSSWQRP